MSQESLRLIVYKIMDLSNVYDYTYTGNYLTTNEYFCFLDLPAARQALHVGRAKLRYGEISHQKMRGSIMREGKQAASVCKESMLPKYCGGAFKIVMNVHHFTKDGVAG